MSKRHDDSDDSNSSKRQKMSQFIPRNPPGLLPTPQDNPSGGSSDIGDIDPPETATSNRSVTAPLPSVTPDAPEYDFTEIMAHDAPAVSPARAGVLERISLINFMCHDSLVIDFGPRLNFIIGKNGSGKSAIITGILVGLGGKASNTDRGSTIKDLIKDGKQTAVISIKFKNYGTDSFKNDEYGDSITIERRIVRTGASSYSVKDNKGKVISHKKALIDEILEAYNIRVDNPLSFLSQDKAREFLSSTSDRAKFDYLMKGILVEDILDNYKEIQSNLDGIESQLKKIKSSSSKYEITYKEAERVYEKFKQSNQLREKLHLLNGKIHWFNTTKLEKIIQKRIDTISGNQSRISDIDASIEEKINEKDRITEEKAQIDHQMGEISDQISELKYNYDSIKQNRDNARTTCDNFVTEIKSNEKNVKASEAELNELKDKLQKEIEKDNDDTYNNSLSRRIQLKREEIEATDREIRLKRSDLENFAAKVPNYQPFKIVADQKRQCDGNLHDLEQRLSSLHRSTSNKYAAWGDNVKSMLNAISLNLEFHRPPLGPIGSYISVKQDHSEWKSLINSVLQSSLDAFLVFDDHDRRILSQIMKKFRYRGRIITRRDETFDYESGKVMNHTTVLDILKFTERNILFTLIDLNSIEKCVIADKGEDPIRCVKEANVLNVYSLVSKTSGRKTTGKDRSVAADPVYYRLREPYKFSEDMEGIGQEIQSTKRSIAEEKRKISVLEGKMEQEKQNFVKEKRALLNELTQLKERKSHLSNEINELERAEENDVQNAIPILEAGIKEAQASIENSQRIMIALSDELEKSGEELKKLSKAVKESAKEIKALEEELDDSKERIQQINDSIIDLDREVTKSKSEKQRLLSSNEEIDQQLVDLRLKLDDNQKKAEECCSREEVPITEEDTAQTIQNEYLSTQRAVEEAEQGMGITLEEAQENYKNSKQKFEALKNHEYDLSAAEAKMSSGLKRRIKYLSQTIDNDFLKASSSFSDALKQRGFDGILRFNKDERTLTMRVSTKKGAPARLVDSLSGGEKSYTQVAFLLSIWGLINSTVSGLDEFDVFMDSPNRTKIIELLLKQLSYSENTQTILITPQDITSIADLDNEDVKIHKMSAPRD